MEDEKEIEKKFELAENTEIHERFIIQHKIGSGGFGKVYLVKLKNTEKKYALKLSYKFQSINSFKREISILHTLGKIKSSYILKLYGFGKFQAEDKIDRNYLVVDYAEKGDLYNFVKRGNGLEEQYAKLLFIKILQGIQFVHDSNICHLDIKVANILLDEKYNPIINDFGLSRQIKNSKGEVNLFKGQKGTKYMMCPEMFEEEKTYNGIDADIFALGVLLYEIVLNKRAFKKATDESYDDIKSKNYEHFWGQNPESSTLSKEFKDLYVKMIAYDPKERPQIQDIIKTDPWLDEIRSKKPTDFLMFEKEYEKYMANIEEKIKSSNQISVKVPENNCNLNLNRGISFEEGQIYFGDDIKPKEIKNKNNYQYFIKIEGFINPVHFMNALIILIQKKYEYNLSIKQSEIKLKFKIKFDKVEDEGDDDKENEEKDEENENKGKMECIMEVKLFLSDNDSYLLCFDKRQGALEEFYENFEIIKDIVKNELI